MNFFIFILVGVGLTNVLVNGSIFNGLRDYIQKKNDFFGKLVHCATCTGMWAGILLSLLLYSPVYEIMFPPTYFVDDISMGGAFFGMIWGLVKWIIAIVFDGCIISIFASFVDSILDTFSKASDYFERSAEHFSIKEDYMTYRMEEDKKVSEFIRACEGFMEYQIKKDESYMDVEEVKAQLITEVVDTDKSDIN